MPETSPIEAESKPKKKSRKKSAALAKKDWRIPGHQSRESMPQPGSVDMTRWFLFECEGMTVEQIAVSQNRKQFEIQASLDYVKEWKFRNRTEMLTVKAVSIAMSRMEDVGKMYDRGLKATKVVHINRETNKVVTHPDFAMQLKTAAEVRALMEATQPKTPGIAIQNNVGFGAPAAGGSGMSFEQVLRKKRGELGLANEQEVDTIEGEVTQEEELADEFSDFGGDDVGEEGEEDSD